MGTETLKENVIERLNALNLNASTADEKFDECTRIFEEEVKKN